MTRVGVPAMHMFTGEMDVGQKCVFRARGMSDTKYSVGQTKKVPEQCFWSVDLRSRSFVVHF